MPPKKQVKPVKKVEESSESEDEVTVPKSKATSEKKPLPKKKTVEESSEDESSEVSSDSDESTDSSDSSDYSDSSDSSDETSSDESSEEESSEEESSEEESSEESEDEKPKKPAAKSANVKGKAPPKKGKPAPKKKEEDLDEIFAELAISTPSSSTTTSSSSAAAASTEGGEKQLSKAQLKRLRQKEKQKQAALQPAPASQEPAKAEVKPKAEASKPEPQKDDKKEDKKDDKSKKTGVSALKQALQKKQELEAKMKQEAEEAKRREEEERRREEEEEKRKAAEKEAKRLARQQEREKLRREGKLLSKQQKKKLERQRLILEQLKAQGGDATQATVEQVAAEQEAAEKEKKKLEKKEKKAKEAAEGSADQQKHDKKKPKRLDKRARALLEAERIRKAEEEQKAKSLSALSSNVAVEQMPTEVISEDEKFVSSGEEVEEKETEQVEEEVLDSWDADEEDEEQKKKEKEAEKQRRIEEKKKRQEARKSEIEARNKDRARRRAALEERRKAFLKEQEEKKRKQEEEERKRLEALKKEEEKKKKNRELRSPIVCVMGHVDTGKTKILDKIRATNVQDGEAGGITQQIGATYLPMNDIKKEAKSLAEFTGKPLDFTLPGLLLIDTPGHESFTNLRSRGSSLCDIAILVVDITAGLEKQTLESIQLLRQRKTPFVVALNKIDRCYDWKSTPWSCYQETLSKQKQSTQDEFRRRTQHVINLFAQQGLNTALYTENPDPRTYVSLVPTSALTGEGIPDLLCLICTLTQNMMNERLSYQDKLSCTVLEVKNVEGLGATLDVILVNGVLREGDTIVVCGLQGPIVTTIRALKTPPPLAEMRVKSQYVDHKEVKAAMGVKICAQGLETAVAGSQLIVVKKGDDIEELKDYVQSDLATVLSRVDKSGKGVYVQASTLGSLEALLTFLEEMKIPVSGISIGDVHKKDVMKAAVMLETKPEYATILAFDVKVSPDAEREAQKMGVKIFTAQIIYHLFDAATKHFEEIRRQRQEASAAKAVFPCILEIFPNMIFNMKNPIVMGCKVIDGFLRVGTPICVKREGQEPLLIGSVLGIQKNHQDFKEAKRGDEVAVKIGFEGEDVPYILYGRHFDAKDPLYSRITRESIDVIKQYFKDDLQEEDWKCVVKLKKILGIQ